MFEGIAIYTKHVGDTQQCQELDQIPDTNLQKSDKSLNKPDQKFKKTCPKVIKLQKTDRNMKKPDQT